MKEASNFMEELLAEAELQEEQQTEAYFDLVLLQIQELQNTMENRYEEAQKEVKMITDFVLRKNQPLQEKINFLEKKLEMFIRTKNAKTIELAHGILKCHKKPDKIEIVDMDLFLKNAKPELLIVQPQEVKPNLNKVKEFLKMSYKGLPGVQIVKGQEEFSYKLIKEKENGGQEETRPATESAMHDRVAI